MVFRSSDYSDLHLYHSGSSDDAENLQEQEHMPQEIVVEPMPLELSSNLMEIEMNKPIEDNKDNEIEIEKNEWEDCDSDDGENPESFPFVLNEDLRQQLKFEPIDAFESIFTTQIITSIVENTNNYAKLKKNLKKERKKSENDEEKQEE